MKRSKVFIFLLVTLLVAVFLAMPVAASTIDDAELERQLQAEGKDQSAGNLFIWFLCAIAFLKISQKVDSFMASLGINVGRTGGSMLAEAMIAGRGLSAAKGAHGMITGRGGGGGGGGRAAAGGGGGGGLGGIPAMFSGGLAGMATRSINNTAVQSVTGQSSGGLATSATQAAYNSSLSKGGTFANNVISRVAHGDINSTGTISGSGATDALNSYVPQVGKGAVAADELSEAGDRDSKNGMQTGAPPPQFKNVEIGGGRITGYEVPQQAPIGQGPGGKAGASGSVDGKPPIAPEYGGPIPQGDTISKPSSEGGGLPADSGQPIPTDTGGTVSSPPSTSAESVEAGATGATPSIGSSESGGRRFAMYSADKYNEPNGKYQNVTAVDGSRWYLQYAEQSVQKTPFQKTPSSQIEYKEKLVQRMPPPPQRKDRS